MVNGNNKLEDMQRKLSFWKAKLDGVASLQLPTDYPRPLRPQVVEAEEVVEISHDTSKALLRLSLDTDVGPFSVVLAAFSVLLHKFTGEEDVVVGTSSAACNPLVLRLPMTSTVTFNELLVLVRETEDEAAVNEVPYNELVSCVRPPNPDEPHTLAPLFQVRFFNLVDTNTSTLDAASTDWTVFVEQKADARRILPLRVRVVYNTVLFAKGRITELLEQLQLLLHPLVLNPSMPIGELSLLTPEACRILPDATTMLDSTWHGAVSDHLSRHARDTPNRPFIREAGHVHSFGSIDLLSNRIARFLVESACVQPEDVVTVYAHRSSSIVVAILGILKAGATFTVIDPAYPEERQIVYLTVAQPRALIVLEKAGQLATNVQNYVNDKLKIPTIAQLHHVDISVPSSLGGDDDSPVGVVVGPETISTLSFTSGSTGIPKGVRGRHISLTHFYPWMATEFGLSESDRFTMLSGIAHDPIQRDIFTPIFFGAELLIPSAKDIAEPGGLAQWIHDNELTVSHLTPAMGQLLSANATAIMSSLRCAFFVGDVLTKRDVTRLQLLAPNVNIVNMYGTTETQRAVSYLTIYNDCQMTNRKEIIPAGVGMCDVQLLILTSCLQPCGIGEVGEIFVRSPHLAWGYLNLEQSTSEKFIENPFGCDKRDRMYRTGDVGRYLCNGIVECIGRSDDQVKIRGFRIELREIDTHLSQHFMIRENITVARRDINEEHSLVSYFVPTSSDFDIGEIRDYLKNHLPSYALPSIIVPLAKMPLTPNGKIDKNKLPFPDTALSNQRKVDHYNDRIELSPMELRLRSIWADILGRLPESISLSDNFFDIGGHSLLATRLIFRMRQDISPDIPMSLLFEQPSLGALVRILEVENRLVLDLQDSENGTTIADNKEQRSSSTESEDLMADVEVTLGNVMNEPWIFPSSPTGIFLTGATGFLGAFLLARLLKEYINATVYCLVRDHNGKDVMARLRANLNAHELWSDDFEARICAVPGDLSVERYGLDAEMWKHLTLNTQLVVHNGALVHWVFPYSKLRSANVHGTQEALLLATTAIMKPLIFVSSTSIFDTDHYIGLETSVKEDDNLAGGTGLTVGYGKSKWVSEKLLSRAIELGAPVVVIRPGYIVGHSKTGVTNTDDFLWRLMKGCIQLGYVPNMLNRVNMCPVDYVANSIVHIMSLESSVGKCFHMVNPNPFRFSDFFKLLEDYGYAVTPINYLLWRQKLMELTFTADDNALYPLLHFVLDDLPSRSKAPELDATNAAIALENTSIICPAIQDIMGVYFANLIRCGYLPEPPNHATAPKQIPILNVGGTLLSRSKK